MSLQIFTKLLNTEVFVLVHRRHHWEAGEIFCKFSHAATWSLSPFLSYQIRVQCILFTWRICIIIHGYSLMTSIVEIFQFPWGAQIDHLKLWHFAVDTRIDKAINFKEICSFYLTPKSLKHRKYLNITSHGMSQTEMESSLSSICVLPYQPTPWNCFYQERNTKAHNLVKDRHEIGGISLIYFILTLCMREEK